MADFDFFGDGQSIQPISIQQAQQVQSGPVAQPVIQPTLLAEKTAGPGWLFLFANAFVCCLCGIVIGYASAQIKWPDVTPSPLDEGTYVLFNLEFDDLKELSKEQQQIIGSVLLRKWADDHCTIEKMEDGTEAAAIRFPDADDDYEKETDEWKRLKKAVTLPPPSVIVAHDGRVKEFKLPPDVETTIKALDAVVK